MTEFINKPLRSFGRVRNRIKDNENLLENLLPKFLIKLPQKAELDPQTLFQNAKKIYLEIGFGHGEFLIQQAINNKDIGFIGCEVYLNGILNLVRKIREYKLPNIRLYDKDARILLKNIKDNTLDKIFILFPDPWPKKKHNKRRIINQEFLNILHKKLKSGGSLFFASDIENYINWTLEHIRKNVHFNALFKDLKECERELNWQIKTKYQNKATKAGRISRFLEFINN
jgi:tRNA (guanine-N7-)-methyltransferase